MKLSIPDVEKISKQRPDGFKANLFASGSIQGEFLFIEDQIFYALRRQFIPNGFGQVQTPKIKPPEFPPVTTQIKNASSALIRATGALLSGERVKAPESVIEARKAICGACEFLRDNRCVKCGCQYRAKIALNTERCPLGKWERI